MRRRVRGLGLPRRYGSIVRDSADGDEVSEAAREHVAPVVPRRSFDDRDRFRPNRGHETDVVGESLAIFGTLLDRS
ncbi:hypothetical protein [Haladaptatus salinisoli]|uniref:hypothetical protein n=1 Tax=Haladaptatus salinisoli TaxID=2884876 RepID=UPI001D0BDDC8|nr:hypothetical protein [Haladaptatus salinisoli]